jgi:hypothetical protein
MPVIPEIITLTMDVPRANIILNSLAEQPWRTVNELIIDIRQQLLRQINPQENNVTPLKAGE